MNQLNERLEAAKAVIPHDGTYHRDISLPGLLIASFVGHFVPDYLDHARRASFNDRYGLIDLPELIRVSQANVVEVEVRRGVAVKAVVRIGYDDKLDLVLVLCRPCSGFVVVKTVWLNEKNDSHATLNRSAYATAA